MMMVPWPEAVAVMLPGVPGPLPPIVAVAIPVGLVLVALSVPVTVAPCWVTKNASGDEEPPPGVGFTTRTSFVPSVARSPDGITAESAVSD